MRVSLDDLRHHAIASSLFPQTSLKRAVAKLRFVQADPIQSPARAQDLILRHRVKDYRAGDLERRYSSLGIEEDYLYAYGFVPLETWQLLHPRKQRALTTVERRVLKIVANGKHLHPRDLEAHLGKDRETNAWGGYSKATTRTLERLHYLGLTRVTGRVSGIKTYSPSRAATIKMTPEERLRQLVLTIASILAPLPASSLRAALRHLGHSAPHLENRTHAVTALIASGDLDSSEVNGVQYVMPAGRLIRRPPTNVVRFLAPFDPLVWDRRRFELFWGWAYRFEAYTPPAKRKLGYYAMPMLWKADVVGWVNASVRSGELSIARGFPNPNVKLGSDFEEAFDEEVERFRHFLGV